MLLSTAASSDAQKRDGTTLIMIKRTKKKKERGKRKRREKNDKKKEKENDRGRKKEKRIHVLPNAPIAYSYLFKAACVRKL